MKLSSLSKAREEGRSDDRKHCKIEAGRPKSVGGYVDMLGGRRLADRSRSASMRKNRFVTTQEPASPTEATPAARTLAICRTRLTDLLAKAQTTAPQRDAEIHFEVTAPVERLSGDLI